MVYMLCGFFFFFFNDTASTEIYTLSLHDALPILENLFEQFTLKNCRRRANTQAAAALHQEDLDRKSTRLNSSHMSISYAVFCLKKKMSTLKWTHCRPGRAYVFL